MSSKYSFRGMPFYGNEKELEALQPKPIQDGLSIQSLIEKTFNGKFIRFWPEKYPAYMQITSARLETEAEYYGERTIILELCFEKRNVKLTEKFRGEAEQLVARSGNFVYINLSIDDKFELKDSIEGE
jgi:hypothetical protein